MLALAAIDLLKREPPRLVAACGLMFRELNQTTRHCSLKDSLSGCRGGTWGDESYPGHGYPILRSTNMRGSYVDVKDPAWREVPPAHADACALESGDILIIKSSGSTDLVGKAALFVHPGDDRTYLFSNFTMCLRPNRNIVLPEFLAWYLRSPQAFSWRYEAQHTTVGLRNLKTPVFLAQKVPVPPMHIQGAVARYLGALEARDRSSLSVVLPPPLDEQRRIVTRIDEMAALIEEAQTLRAKAREEADALMASAIRQVFDLSRDLPPGWRWVTVSSIGSKEHEAVQTGPFGAQLSSSEFTQEGVPVLAIGNVQWGYLDTRFLKHVSEDKADQLSRYRLRAGDILFARMGTVGRSCVVPDSADNWLISYHLIRIAVDRPICDPQFVFYALRGSPSVLKAIEEKTRGSTRAGVNSTILRNLEFPLPPLDQQHRIVVYLNALQARADGLTSVQDATQAELDALLPSVLDRAFRGEL